MNRALVERALQPQPDGTYLVRPEAPFGGVYQITEETKERYIAVQVLYLRLSAVALAITLFLHNGVPGFGSWLFVAAVAIAWALFGFISRRMVLRGCPRVGKERWAARRFAPAFDGLPAWVWALLATSCGALFALSAFVLLDQFRRSGIASLELIGVLYALVFLSLAGMFAYAWRGRRRLDRGARP